ncbi:TRPM3-like protein [Mya arenaria]|uniref:TRPM3-like protein n=1 Tax=Mya arenaria TaxID=6604 RepID=A0ABY7FFC0_MYAAR|nr:TRPM3-like protein [Mya arenaria]
MASVYPDQSYDYDTGYSHIDYHGGVSSSVSFSEREYQKNQMTLKEARWVGVRKKVPGMSGVPSKSQSKAKPGKSQSKSQSKGQSSFLEGYIDEEDPYLKKIHDMNEFITQHFRQKECQYFVPKKVQKPVAKHIRDLKCQCGEVLSDHKAVRDSPTDYVNIVPQELQALMAPNRRLEPPPDKLPQPARAWDATRDLQVSVTTSFGKMNFENVEHVGGKKPAKYVRITDEADVGQLLDMMKIHWRIMEPQVPNLVISVVGGAKNFKLDGRMRDVFSTGLIKAAKTTSAWLITSGFNMGVMKSVGQAVRQGQSFCWDDDRMAHVLRCIGIAPWGYVKDRKVLEGNNNEGKYNANYRTSNVILHDSAVPLNPDHTHFIFVDDGYRVQYGGVSGIRAQLEQKISQPESEGGLGIPLVLVVVEGGVDSIKDACKSLEHNIPVVVCDGTGRAADILAYAYKHTKSHGGERVFSEEHKPKLRRKIQEAYSKNWKPEEYVSKLKTITETVHRCCVRADLLHIFNMNKHEDLDLAILSVLLKAKQGTDEAQRLSQLKLALAWDRSDIAQEEIFREDILWNAESLQGVLTEALTTHKVQFVQLILHQGIVMKEYLTYEVLEKLYESVPKHNYLYKILHRLTGKDSLTLENVRLLLLKLLDKYDTMEELLVDQEEETDEGKVDQKKRHFKHPYKMLLAWALLLKQERMAKLFWELGDEPVTSALVATKMYQTMSKYLPKHESHLQTVFKDLKSDFELLATNVLDECHHNDPGKAMMIAERESPSYNQMSCMQIAAAASDQAFLSSPTCFSSMNVYWKHGILFTLTKMILCLIFPPYVAFGLEILEAEGGKKISKLEKMFIFYTSPLSKFAHGMILYGVFLILHSYMVLVDFRKNEVTALEIVIVIWVFSFFVDEIHTFISFPSPTIWSKIRDWYGFLKWLDLFNFVLAFIGFLLHTQSDQYKVVKILYCINSIIFYLRIMKIYIANGQLGPKMFMIRRMLDELRMFIMVMIVFLLAYGVASQGLLYHVRSPSWTILKDVLYFPYWQLYGEIYLDEIDSNVWGQRQLEYLQLFEKEMMMNHLRHKKAHELSSIDTTINKLQKRVDELTKLVEEEVVADTTGNQPWKEFLQQFQYIQEEGPDMNKETAGDLEPLAEAEEETTNKKHKKKKKKHKKREQSEERDKGDNLSEKEDKLKNNLNITEPDKPEPREKLVTQQRSERGLLPAFVPDEDSETDNVSPKYQRKKEQRSEVMSPRFQNMRKGDREELSRMYQQLQGSDSSSDEVSQRRREKLRKKKKKAKKSMFTIRTESD